MAEFLLMKGANVDGGSRSSSLHYAAIFGRPDIAKLLIENGANPELRDEEGKTPLEKARERHEEGHKQVARLLEKPLKKHHSNNSAVCVDDVIFQEIFSSLVPILCSVKKDTLLTEVKRSSISLIRKCIAHLPTEILREQISKKNYNNAFADNFLGLLENTLIREDDLEIKEQFMLIMKDILERDYDFWIQHISRLGVYVKVEALASDNIPYYVDYSYDNIPDAENRILDPSSFNIPPSMPYIDVKNSGENVTIPPTIIDEINYHGCCLGIKNLKWGNWRISFVNGETFIWCDVIAVKLNNDDTMSFHCTENVNNFSFFGTRNDGNDLNITNVFREQFLNMKEVLAKQDIEECFNNNVSTYGFMDWRISEIDADNLCITHVEHGSARIDIRKNFPGFTYHPEDGEATTILSKNPLTSIFATGFTKCKTIDRDYEQSLKINVLASVLWDNYLKDCKNRMRKEFAELKACADNILKLLDGKIDSNVEKTLYTQLDQVRNALVADNNLSIFEIAHSGIVDTFCYILAVCIEHPRGMVATVFKEIFGVVEIVIIIIKKFVSVLETLESFPIVLHDKPNSTINGMKLLNQKYLLELEQADPNSLLQQKLLNQTGKKMKAEPLCSGTHLKYYLLQKLSKYWYDVDRKNLSYVQTIINTRNKGEEIVFEYNHDFDANGILFFIGTNGFSETKYENPVTAGLIKMISSDGKHVPYDPCEEIFSRSPKPMNIHTRDIKGSFFAFDIGVYVYPTAYTLRHSRGYPNSALRNWTFEGSVDNKRYYVISRHVNDVSLSNETTSSSWSVNPNVDIPFRYFRVVQQDVNSNGKTYYLSLAGFELYGNVVDVVVSLLL